MRHSVDGRRRKLKFPPGVSPVHPPTAREQKLQKVKSMRIPQSSPRQPLQHAYVRGHSSSPEESSPENSSDIEDPSSDEDQEGKANMEPPVDGVEGIRSPPVLSAPRERAFKQHSAFLKYRCDLEDALAVSETRWEGVCTVWNLAKKALCCAETSFRSTS
jgi:hypothetical protein